MLHSLSLVEYEGLDKKAREKFKIARPKPQTAKFINLRAKMPNLLFSMEDWNKEIKKLSAVVKSTCFNKFMHADPETFKDTAKLHKHNKTCHGTTSVRGRNSRGKGR